MKEFKIETNVQCFSYDELPDIYQTLIDKAKQQTHTAYAPYSKFHARKYRAGSPVRPDRRSLPRSRLLLCNPFSASPYTRSNCPADVCLLQTLFQIYQNCCPESSAGTLCTNGQNRSWH